MPTAPTEKKPLKDKKQNLTPIKTKKTEHKAKRDKLVHFDHFFCHFVLALTQAESRQKE
jgi:hypothetical protein